MRRLTELLLMLVVCQGLATPLSDTIGAEEDDENSEVLSSLTLLREDASANCKVGNGASYRGIVSVTGTGKTCQRWDSQTPHEHTRTPADYPSSGLEQNYCRNPDGWTGVWCYTTDPSTRWERCDIPDCGEWLARDQSWAVGSSGTTYSLGGLTFDAGKVLDGDTDTFWNPDGLERYYNNWYVVLDLRVPYSLFRIGIANFGDAVHDIKSFTLQKSASGDPYSWQSVTSADDIVAGTNERQERGGFAATARYWRLIISRTHTGWQPWLLELELYGSRVLSDAPPGYGVFRNNCIRHRNQLGSERNSSVQRCAEGCDSLLPCRSFDFNFHHLTCSLSTDNRESASQAYENCPVGYQLQTDYYEKQDQPQTRAVPAPAYYNSLDHPSTFSTPNGHTLEEGVGGSALRLESRRNQYANLGDFAGTCLGSTLNCPRGFTLAFWFKRPAADNRPQYYINSGGHDFPRTRGFTLTKTAADLGNDFYNVAVNGRLFRHEAKIYLSAEKWTHVAVTWVEERGLEIFVDGMVQQTVELETEIPPLENDPHTDVFLGSANTHPGEHTGEAMFDELKFWDWVLSDGQIQLAMVPGSVQAPVCADQRDHCQDWASEGHCNNNYQSYMRQYCPRSCGFCPGGTTDSPVVWEDATVETPMLSPEQACVDRNQYCASWSSQGYCRTNYAYMAQSCRRACGFCTVSGSGTDGSMPTTNCMDNHYHCPSWATRGFCARGNSHYTYMMRYCRKSCRKCTTEGTGTGAGGQGGGNNDCRDTHQHCEDWAKRGECTKNPNYMHVRCRPSCGLCTTGGGNGGGGAGGTGGEGGDGDSDEETEMEEEDTDEGEEEMEEDCGMQYLTESPGIARIVGGKVAVPGAWPWMAFLYRKGLGHLCGGTLISSRWVLTAAHCLTGRSADEIEVYLGKHHEDKTDPMEQRFSVKKIIIHEGFSLPSYRNDVALIKLPRRAMLNEIANLACLPDDNMADTTQDGSCVTTGWGDTLGTGGEGVLKQLFLPLIPTQKCNSTSFYNGRLQTSMLCAGFEKGGQDSCRGDSGGPLVCSMDGRWYLMGITSWGRGCALPKRPGVYARVSEFSSWIEEMMLNN
ncbi:apolipoprotein(a)-like [Branchiostoma lanceolatum]|uniref:apolipoprotein(a)-like n=1 Tax=Branchiostoma lanceolatum TaxID=7740 RepID=UPI003454CCFD